MSSKEKLSTKQNKEKLSTEELTQFDLEDQLAIDPDILAEIKGKNLAFRWINGVKFRENYGFDARRWIPYKSETAANSAFGFKDSEGYIRRGDLILATRPMSVNNAHKAKIQRKNETLAASQNNQAAEELRERMRDAGVKAKIYQGFEEND